MPFPLKALLIYLRTSLWFVPMTMVAGAILLAYGCLTLDERALAPFDQRYAQPFAGGADSIRMMLSAIATSVITVAGITFSLTISSLAQVANQLTARVLRNFMSKLTNKLVLGFFVGLFTYCIIVIRTIRIPDDAAGPFVPALSVSVAMVLAVGAMGVVAYFVHYVALSVQATTVVASVAQETLEIIDRLFPDRLPDEARETRPELATALAIQTAQVIAAATNGYVQLIDEQGLRRLAHARRLTVRVEAATGDFVTQQTPLVSLVGISEPLDEATERAFHRAFVIGRTRSVEQEVAFGLRQLVDIGLKALSAASADTTTAVLVIDYLTAVLVRLVQRRMLPTAPPEGYLPKLASFATSMDGALDQLRDAASANPVVLTRLLVLVQTVGRPTANAERRAVLLGHARRIAEEADRSLGVNYHRGLVRQQLVETLGTLHQPPDAFGGLLEPV